MSLRTRLLSPLPDREPRPHAFRRLLAWIGPSRWMIWPAAMTILLLLTAIAPESTLRDAATGLPAHGARLVFPAWYVVLAPLSDTLDALSMLSEPQHVALVLSVLVVFAGWRAQRLGRRPGRISIWPIREALAGVAALGALALVYLASAILPRPMARLRLDDPDEVAVDFHSHTGASWDARAGFSAAGNRAWHEAAGFDVVAITDHRTFAGAEDGERHNPRLGGGVPLLLSGLEARDSAEHVLVFGLSARDSSMLDRGELTRDALATADTLPDGPVVILAIPADLSVIPATHARTLAHISALELSDASPRGLAQEDRERRHLLHVADSLDLAVVAGSNNHGWGRTAVAWTAMRVPGWRRLPPDSVGAQIRRIVHRDGRRAARVIERSRPTTAPGSAALVAMLPDVAWLELRTLTLPERVSWLLWCWGLAGVAVASRRRAVPAGALWPFTRRRQRAA